MKRLAATAAALSLLPTVVASPALAKKRGDELPPMKAGIHQQCLRERAEGAEPAPDAWIALGQLDQVRGDLKAAFEKYRKAFDLGVDVTKAQLDFTLVNGVIWIQNDACPVPVPALSPAALMSAPASVSLPEIRYPQILLNTQSEGNVQVRAWIDEKGNAHRVAVTEATAGIPLILRRTDLNVDSTNRPGVEAAERMVSRVQFALTVIEALRATTFEKKARGKVVEGKVAFRPPNDMTTNLPGGGPNTAAGEIYDPQNTGK